MNQRLAIVFSLFACAWLWQRSAFAQARPSLAEQLRSLGTRDAETIVPVAPVSDDEDEFTEEGAERLRPLPAVSPRPLTLDCGCTKFTPINQEDDEDDAKVRPYDHVWIAGLALFLGAFTIGAIESYAVAGSRNGAASLVPVIGVEYVIAKNAPPADRGLVLGGSGALQMAGLLILAAGLSF
jgi:hypothetical protein